MSTAKCGESLHRLLYLVNSNVPQATPICRLTGDLRAVEIGSFRALPQDEFDVWFSLVW